LKKNITYLLLLAISFYGFETFAQDNKITWQENIGGSQMDIANDIVEGNNHSFYTVGYSYSNDGNFQNNLGWEDAKIIKTNKSGLIEWERSFGGSDADVFTSITSQGDFVIAAGWSASEDAGITNRGSEDALIVKYDASGNLVWIKSYGGSSSDRINQIITLQDGNYLLAGYTYSNNNDITVNRGMVDFWMLKLDQNGNIMWSRTYGGSDDDFASALAEDSNGDIIIVGNSTSIDFDVAGNYGEWDAWIIKTNAIGEILWQNVYGDVGNDEIAAVNILDKDEIVLVGNTFSNNSNALGKSDGWVLHLDMQGSKLKETRLGGEENDYIYSVDINSDGDLLLSGQTHSNSGDLFDNQGNGDGWLVAINISGYVLWQETLGGNSSDDIQNAIYTSSGSIAIAGSSKSNNGDVIDNNGSWDFWLVEINGNSKTIDEDNLMLFPNPALDNINFFLQKKTVELVTITNMAGQIISTQNFNEQHQGQIDITAFPAGIYTIHCISANEKFTKNFIKL
jgi:hypothetical protein